jgi:hypothetical protein
VCHFDPPVERGSFAREKNIGGRFERVCGEDHILCIIGFSVPSNVLEGLSASHSAALDINANICRLCTVVSSMRRDIQLVGRVSEA